MQFKNMNHGFETGRYPGHWRITGKQTIIIHVLRVTDAIQKACISYRSSHVPVNMLALAHLDRIHWPEGLKKLNLNEVYPQISPNTCGRIFQTKL